KREHRGSAWQRHADGGGWHRGYRRDYRHRCRAFSRDRSEHADGFAQWRSAAPAASRHAVRRPRRGWLRRRLRPDRRIRHIAAAPGGSGSGGGYAPSGGYGTSRPPEAAQPDTTRHFVAVVVADTEDVWKQVFGGSGKTYVEPKLVLYTGRIASACGLASTASGPFYCPNDQKVYLDLSFFEEMKTRFHAPGEFAEAYVIAHETGHHVQNSLGI